MIKTIKEIIIMLLVCLITMLILAIALYQYIPNRKAIPEITTYVATEDVQDLLEDDIDTRSNDENVILTYEVTSNDLKNYQNTNDYVPGKSNPFAPASSSTSSEGESSDTNSSDTSNSDTTDGKDSNSSGKDAMQTTPNVYSQNTGTK